MNLEEMINHLYIAESILEHMAEIADPESATGNGYTDAAEKIGDLIVDLERFDYALQVLTEDVKPAEQVAVKIPNTEFPIYVDLHKSKTESKLEDQRPTLRQMTESKLEDQQARY